MKIANHALNEDNYRYLFFTYQKRLTIVPETKKSRDTNLGFTLSTRGGNRTHTPKNWILNPARLPIPPLELFKSRTAKLKNIFVPTTKL